MKRRLYTPAYSELRPAVTACLQKKKRVVGPKGVHALDDGVGFDKEVGVDPLVDLLRHAV